LLTVKPVGVVVDEPFEANAEWGASTSVESIARRPGLDRS
jgi:hypothetical protein